MNEFTQGEGANTRETEISAVLSNLNRTVKVLNEIIDSFELRLQAVIRPDEGVECGSDLDPGYGTKLAQNINDNVRKIASLSNHLENLRNRIEL